jgi:hypothetical protein
VISRNVDDVIELRTITLQNLVVLAKVWLELMTEPLESLVAPVVNEVARD